MSDQFAICMLHSLSQYQCCKGMADRCVRLFRSHWRNSHSGMCSGNWNGGDTWSSRSSCSSLKSCTCRSSACKAHTCGPLLLSHLRKKYLDMCSHSWCCRGTCSWCTECTSMQSRMRCNRPRTVHKSALWFLSHCHNIRLGTSICMRYRKSCCRSRSDT